MVGVLKPVSSQVADSGYVKAVLDESQAGTKDLTASITWHLRQQLQCGVVASNLALKR